MASISGLNGLLVERVDTVLALQLLDLRSSGEKGERLRPANVDGPPAPRQATQAGQTLRLIDMVTSGGLTRLRAESSLTSGAR
jgi:hypothetical protein